MSSRAVEVTLSGPRACSVTMTASGALAAVLRPGDTLSALGDPGADRIVFWDDSAGVWAYLTVGSGLSISGTTLNCTASGTGTVTSVALSLPAIFSVSGSPVTTSGTLSASLATQNANLVWAGPATSPAAAPTFRSLVAADIPSLSSVYLPLAGGTLEEDATLTLSLAADEITHTAVLDGDSLAFTADGTEADSSASYSHSGMSITDGVNTLSAGTADITLTDGANTVLLGTNYIELGNTDTTLTRTSAGNVAIEGNIIYRAGGTDVPVADGGTGISSGTSGGVPYFSGTTTIASSAALAANAIVLGGGAGSAPATTATGTGVVTALGVNVGSAGAFVVNGGALGTPSSGTVTNLTGTASININGTVGATTPAAGTFTTLVAGSTTSLLLGTAGSAVGNIGFRNATSGTATLAPPTGALGTYTVTLPNAASTLPIFGQQITFAGPTAARTVTFPDANFTAARTDSANTFTGASTITSWLVTTDIRPSSNDGASLGVSGTAFSDLFLAAGGIINFGAGDVLITSNTNQLDFTGASNGYGFDAVVAPTSNDGAALGLGAAAWSDLFLASGAVVNFANGDAVLTHSSGVITVSTGDLRMTTAGTNSASVVTVGGAQTLTNKTLTSPLINLASPGTDDTGNGIFSTANNAGATIAQWEAVYLGATFEWLLADANGSGTYPAMGLAYAAGTDGNPLTVLLRGIARNDAWNWSVGLIYLSTTAGGLTQTAPSTSGDKVQVIGYALSADTMMVDPDLTYLTIT